MLTMSYMENKMISKNNIRASLGTLSFLGLTLCAFSQPYYNKNNQGNLNNSYIFETKSIESIIHSASLKLDNNSDNKSYTPNPELSYVVNSLDFSKLSNPDVTTKKLVKTPVKSSAVKKPIIYGGVEVNDLEKFDNAKLVGVNDENIEFYNDNTPIIYFAKGLLFELNDNKLLNIIAPNSPFYVGQRYDISYHTFKASVKVTTENVLNMYLNTSSRRATISGADYSGDYDGAIVSYKLSRKNK